MQGFVNYKAAVLKKMKEAEEGSGYWTALEKSIVLGEGAKMKEQAVKSGGIMDVFKIVEQVQMLEQKILFLQSKAPPTIGEVRCACPVCLGAVKELAKLDQQVSRARALVKGLRVTPQTQKARGIKELERVFLGMSLVTKHVVFGVDTEAEEALRQWQQFPVFARPCPVRPRHGFVESRVVEDTEALLRIVQEVREQEQDAEIALVKPEKAKWSGIFTPGLVVIGPGTDGATSGKKAMTLPVREDVRLNKDLEKAIERVVKETVYVEFLADSDGGKEWLLKLVQLRDGPKQGAEADFVPREMRVGSVRKVNGEEDLLKWEKEVKEMPEGAVVWHEGGSPASHFGVHCITSGVAYVTSREPRVGEVLKPSESWDVDIEGLKKGFEAGEAVSLTESRETAWAFKAMLLALHNAFWLQRTRDGSVVLGFMCAVVPRMAVMAIMGEERHARESKVGGKSRESVYVRVDEDVVSAVMKIGEVYRTFLTPSKWGGTGGGYGGPKWARCALRTWECVNAAVELARGLVSGKEVQQRFEVALGAVNKLVNCAHNNGRFLNKFGDEAGFTQASRGDFMWLLGAAVGSVAVVGSVEEGQRKKIVWAGVEPLGEIGSDEEVEMEGQRRSEPDVDEDECEEEEVPHDPGLDVCLCDMCVKSAKAAEVLKSDGFPKALTVERAQACWRDYKLHVQFKVKEDGMGYRSADVILPMGVRKRIQTKGTGEGEWWRKGYEKVKEEDEQQTWTGSLAGSGKLYRVLSVEKDEHGRSRVVLFNGALRLDITGGLL